MRQTTRRFPLIALKRSICTIRFEWLCRAGLLQHIAGRQTIKLAMNLPVREGIEYLLNRLQAA